MHQNFELPTLPAKTHITIVFAIENYIGKHFGSFANSPKQPRYHTFEPSQNFEADLFFFDREHVVHVSVDTNMIANAYENTQKTIAVAIHSIRSVLIPLNHLAALTAPNATMLIYPRHGYVEDGPRSIVLRTPDWSPQPLSADLYS